MQQNLENANKYYAILPLGLIRIYSTFSHYFDENYCRLTNSFEGKGLKHCGCGLFSAIVHRTHIITSFKLGRLFKSFCVLSHTTALY